MPKPPRRPRTTFGRSNLYREIAYLHEDEMRAVEKAADKERCSKSEIIRRAIRAYLDIED